MQLFWIYFWVIIGIIAFICLLRGFSEPYMLCSNSCTITVNKLPDSFDGVRIVHLSDMHACSFGKDNSTLSEMVRREHPDYIFATGDFISRSRGAYQDFLKFLDGCKGLCPVIFSFGNHESWIGKTSPRILQEFLKELEQRGVIILNDGFVTLCKGDSSIAVFGLTPERGDKYQTVKMDEKKITEKLGKCPIGQSVLLLAHEPQFFSDYARWGAQAVFSGHVHGGIVRLPFIGGILSSDHGLFPQYDGGIYHIDSSVMLVSRGLGCSHVRFRLFNKPEIMIVTLKKGQ